MKRVENWIKQTTIILFLLLGGFLIFRNTAYAAEGNLDDAKKGIVQVNLVYSDDDGNNHIIDGGTGFLIGDEKENVEYVVTSKHIVSPDKEYIKAALASFGVPEEDLDNKTGSVRYQVVVANDVTTDADLFIDSDNLDMAVLELSEPLNKKTMLTVYTSEDGKTSDLPYKETDTVYTLGFPSAINFESNPAYYGSDQVVMLSGKIINMHTINDVYTITHDIAIGGNNCGGPLLDENGYVIGMNVLAMDGDYYVAVDATELIEIFDSFGMKYSKISKIETEKDPVDDLPHEDTKTVIPLLQIVVGCVFASMFIIMTILVVIMLIKQRKHEVNSGKPKKVKASKKEVVLERPFETTWSSDSGSQVIGDMSDTSVLSQPSSDETSVLQTPDKTVVPISRGKLIRKKTGENIDLVKDRTVVGKDSLHVDYCIRDNSAISRMHLIITANKTGVYAEDAHSTNGTYLNGRKLAAGEQVELRGGENIRLGNEEFIFRK